MPSKDEKQALIDILDNIILGTSPVKNLTYKEFLRDKVWETIHHAFLLLENVVREELQRYT